ncbi:ABC transporter [Mycobacterium kansasii]|uniref:DUF302 domain-containing protein n=1 Tax=Mycobacterium attenuatum TaxID=2341086 RepID=A0A498Q286_9MYCO|nr:DUF302 domain-containing protein [Mycobacterium attenuatum]ORB87091.1 ABC transporter [Mycobacterium kansasii]VBA39024.1 hypothetical protein LAUMK136_02753 [Mycobacterium attenuatum]VBA53260.1 hypothetical protein LAUMK191_02720 [Mycobacterium attenuatum]VBA58106.1 hypothetical protein LAUMK41_02796 [Mycobacterium attenuatum]
MDIALTTTLHTGFDEAVTRTREALAQQGFGVLTEIDVKATLKAKLGEDMENYLILGACNPQLAHRAIGATRQIGTLLPCNVVVRSHPEQAGTIVIEAMNPRLMADVTGEPKLVPIAEEVTGRIQAVIDELERSEAAAERSQA